MELTSLSADRLGTPPIVLLVEDDADTSEMYSILLESAGMWVAKAGNPADALQQVDDLLPDVVVTDLGFGRASGGIELVDALTRKESTANVPIIVLSGQSREAIPAATRAQAALCLEKPVLPVHLASEIARVLGKSRELRERHDRASNKAADLIDRSNAVKARARAIDARVHTSRCCPECRQELDWIETGRIDGRQYDYYHWCARGCGLHCYDRDTRRWVRLAG